MTAELEIEVKLTGPASELRAAFAGMRGDRPIRRRLLTTYYDTPGGSLRRRGFALRVRETNGGRELTLKQDRGDGLTRDEWSAALPASAVENAPPDLRLLRSRAPLAQLGIEDGAALLPVFHTDFERRTTEIQRGDAVVEVALDEGRIVAGERHEPLAELEFELLSGPVGDMLAGVRAVVDERRLSVGTRSKAARGADLWRDGSPSAVKAKPANLDASDAVGEALVKVCRVASRHALGNVAPIMDAGDPEGVHQLRVSLRRLRSALLFFGDHAGSGANRLKKGARRALRRLGSARDLDVFLLETLPPVVEANGAEPGLTHLREAAEARRAAAYADARRLLGGRRFNRFLLDLLGAAASGGLVAKGADEPLLGVARGRLAARHRRLMRLAEGFEQLTPAERHRVRIALKKLRYACDYSRGLFRSDATRAYLARLSGLQDELGGLNDAAVARRIARELATDDPRAATGAALVRAACVERVRAAEPDLRRAWREFAATPPFWNGARAGSGDGAGPERAPVPA